MKIGLPRALLYHRYGVLWEVFFKKLGCETVVSPDTTFDTMSMGAGFSVDECCLPLKVFLGHVKSLDIGSACLGFIDGMELAAVNIDAGHCRHALIVAGENSAPILETTIGILSAPEANRNDFFRNFDTLTQGSGG